jgi:HAE1 family hydrophobic/amphiphilic exporter-1
MWNLAIKRAITFTMVFLIILGFGFWSLSRLNPDLLPDIQIPIAGVIASYPGTGPEDVENLITKKIEGACATVNGVTEVHSFVLEGQSITLVEFEWGKNMDQAAFDIREKIDFIQAFLPSDVDKPMVLKFDPTMFPIMIVTLAGEKNTAQLRWTAENEIKPALERIEGVASATVLGGLKREIKVNLSKDRLHSYGISQDDVINALRAQNLTLPGGTVERADKNYTLRTIGEFQSPKEIEDVIVGYRGAAVIQIKDIGEVLDTYEERTTDAIIDGKNGVLIMLQKESGAITVDVSKKATKTVDKLNKKLPQGIELAIVMDQAEFIERSTGRLTRTLIEGGILAIIVLLFFLHNLTPTIIIAVSIPTSVIATFVAMDLFGLSINIMTLGGLALAIGMLVDNSIVVLENIFRRRQTGDSRKKAASIGTSEVATAISASTLTTIMVFLPVLLVPGIVGIIFKDFALTVTVALIVSLFVALTLIPLMSSRFLHAHKQKGSNIFTKISSRITNWMEWLNTTYTKGLAWALGHKKIVVFSSLGLFVVSILMVKPLNLVGAEFFTQPDMGEIRLDIKLPPGALLEETEEVVHQVENVIYEHVPETDKILSIIGGSGMMFGMGTGSQTNRASVSIELVDVGKREDSQEEITERVRPYLKKIPGAEILTSDEQSSMMMMGAFGSAIEVEIYGYDLDELTRLAHQVKEIIEPIPGVRDVEISREEKAPEFALRISKEKAQTLGLPVAVIANAVNNNVRGKVASLYREEGEEYNIRVRLQKEDRQDINDILTIPIKTPFGSVVQLGEIATYVSALGPSTIERIGQKRVISVSADFTGRDLGSVVQDIETRINKIPRQEGYFFNIGGQEEQRREAFMWLGYALVAAIFLVYMIMASLYESFLDPFVIMFTVPLAAIGVIVMLFLTDTTLNVMSIAGMVILVGIVVNNGIVMIDYINLLRRRDKMGLIEAVMLGAQTRLRPILMTALTTIFAMIPMAMALGEGAEMRAPMARAVIGGLITSTFLTLFFLPSLYTAFEKVLLKWKERRKK